MSNQEFPLNRMPIYYTREIVRVTGAPQNFMPLAWEITPLAGPIATRGGR